MDRRNFIKKGSALGAAGLAGISSTALADEPATLYRAKGEPAAAVTRIIKAMGGIEAFVKPGNRVVIKPNMSFASGPEQGCNTHPKLVAAVARMCAGAGARKVVVLDHTLRDEVVCKEKSGIVAACKGIPKTVVFVPAQQKYYSEVAIPKGIELKKVAIASVVQKADVLINMPTAKSHSATGVSLGMKNWMGAIWDRRYFHKAVNCNQAIADLATIMKPNLVIMDAIYALTTNGPAGPGKVEKLDTVIAGTDQVAVDSYCVGLAKWYGKSFSGTRVEHIKRAAELGLGEINEDNMYIRTV